MGDFVRRRPLLVFYILSVLIAMLVIIWSIWLSLRDPSSALAIGNMVTQIAEGPGFTNIVTIFEFALQTPMLFAIFVFASAPTIAAFIVVLFGAGGGLKLWLSRLKPVGPDGSLKSSAWLYAGLLAVYAAGFGVYDFVGGPDVDISVRLAGFGTSVVFGALIGLFVDEGGTLEEMGWRAFAWPLLQDRLRTPLFAAVVLGILHWAWHLPREAPGLLGGMQMGTFLFNQLVFVILCIALAIVAGNCVNRTGGSVWPAIFVHGGTNVWGKGVGDFAAPSFGFLDLRTLLVIVIALIVIGFAGRQLGRPVAPAS
jgi:hypothetical protein